MGNFLWGWLGDVFKNQEVAGTAEKAVNFQQLFLVPMGFALLAAVILAIFFHPDEKAAAPKNDAEV